MHRADTTDKADRPVTARRGKKSRQSRATALVKPPLPPSPIDKRHLSFQFPQTLLEWLNYPLAQSSSHGLIGQQPRRHIVLCGFPRGGTTLLQLIVQQCVEGVQGFPTETRALHVARFVTKQAAYLFTKCPGDIFRIDEIIRYYESRPTEPRILLMMRDPRAVLTSFHSSRPGEYACCTQRWKATWDFWAWAGQFPQTQIVRYEELICNPAQVEVQLVRHIGWSLQRPFERFHEQVNPNFSTSALNGLRALDPSTIDRWRDARHAQRLREVVRELPELPQILCELGYERDDAWIAGLSSARPAKAA
jgi:hypothetical protein